MRSVSVQEALNDSTNSVDPQATNSRSDSSFNYESNFSEDKELSAIDCYKYQSLESVNSRLSSHTDCNSIRVNFDEGSTFNSLKDEQVTDVSQEQSNGLRLAEPSTASTQRGCWSSETLNGNASLTHTASATSVSSSKSSQSKMSRSFSAHSGRQLRRKKSKSRPKTKANDSVSSNSMTQCSVSNPDLPQCRSSSSSTKKTKLNDPAANWSILPIFKQLIVQKHQETANKELEPYEYDSPVAGDTWPTTASCPNLSIKCDVVEYF